MLQGLLFRQNFEQGLFRLQGYMGCSRLQGNTILLKARVFGLQGYKSYNSLQGLHIVRIKAI